MNDILFPTSVIGSLPRPQFVKDLIADDCPIQGDEYRRLMGDAVRAAVALQETAGLDIITDGEWWRKSYIGVIAELAHGCEDPSGMCWQHDRTTRESALRDGRTGGG